MSISYKMSHTCNASNISDKVLNIFIVLQPYEKNIFSTPKHEKGMKIFNVRTGLINMFFDKT